MASRNPLTSLQAGVKRSVATASMFEYEHIGDVLMYSGSNTQKMLIGQSNVSVPPQISIHDNCVTVASNVDLNVGGNATLNETHIGFSSDATTIPELKHYTFSNQATFASPVIFAGSTVFTGPTLLSGLPVAVGQAYSNSPDIPMTVTDVAEDGISIFAAGEIVSLSDASTKTDIRRIQDAVGKVSLIGGYTFAWTETETGGRSAGVLAQEVQSQLPEVVKTTLDGRLGVAYGPLNALLVEAVKDVAASQTLVSVTTTVPDEEFDIGLPNLEAGRRSWKAAFVSSNPSGPSIYSRVHASITPNNRLVGRAEVPGQYNVIVVSNCLDVTTTR